MTEWKRIDFIVEMITMLIMICLMAYTIPLWYQDKELYGKCEYKILCEQGKLDNKLCGNTSINSDLIKNITVPNFTIK